MADLLRLTHAIVLASERAPDAEATDRLLSLTLDGLMLQAGATPEADGSRRAC